MITYRDIIELNRKRGRKKKISGSKKSLIALFAFLFILITVINAAYGIGIKITEYFRDTDYPHSDVIIVRFDWEKRRGAGSYIKPYEIRRMKEMPGVKSLQEEFYISTHHHFELNRVNYIQPGHLVGYDEAFFNLYTQLPVNQWDKTAVPVLLSRDLFNLAYIQSTGRFVRQDQRELDDYLGRKFYILIDPYCGRGHRWEWDEDGKILSQPDRLDKMVRQLQKETLESLGRLKPHDVRYCNPLTLRFQIVGFVREKCRFENYPAGYGVIPSDMARSIEAICTARRNKARSLRPGWRTSGEKPTRFVQILAVPEKMESLIKEIEAMGFRVDTRGSLSNRFLSDLIAEIRKEVEVIYVAAFVFVPIFFLILLAIYKILSINVKDAIREIGIMRCIGATQRDIRRIFFSLCVHDVMKILMLSLMVSNLGLLAAGYKTAALFNQIPENMIENEIGILLTGISDFSMFWLIAPPWIQIIPVVPLIPITLLAAYLPTRKASKVDPVVATRA